MWSLVRWKGGWVHKSPSLIILSSEGWLVDVAESDKLDLDHFKQRQFSLFLGKGTSG